VPTLSTHVLDTSRGQPAAGVVVELHSHGQLLGAEATNADGRAALGDLPPGVYDLTFLAGDYFRARGVPLTDPPFLNEVVIRCGIAEGHYHVPLLLSPYAYSTYRGS
jgi:5-hydroxyisourate hydrolase